MSHAQRHEIRSSDIASLQVVAGNDWQGEPVIDIDGDKTLTISFDELSHQYHRFVYSLTHCEPDWSETQGIFQSDYLSGFQDNVTIDNYEESLNTNQLYTHYSLTIPNSVCRPKISGNYRLDIIDDETRDTVLVVRFMVAENACTVCKTIRTDTDVDIRKEHQQVDVKVDYGTGLQVLDPSEQFKVLVRQNHRIDNQVWLEKSQITRLGVLEWNHDRRLIFPAGNEFHKFEILDVHRNSMGVEHLSWDGEWYNVELYHDYPRRAYVYDEDANGAFFIRNSDNSESDITSEYTKVHFYLDTPRFDGDVYIDGKWTLNTFDERNLMNYDEEHHWYHVEIPLKYGYYSYEYLLVPGTRSSETGVCSSKTLMTEGDFYQTENDYTVFVYYHAPGGRTWRLIAVK